METVRKVLRPNVRHFPVCDSIPFWMIVCDQIDLVLRQLGTYDAIKI